MFGLKNGARFELARRTTCRAHHEQDRRRLINISHPQVLTLLSTNWTILATPCLPYQQQRVSMTKRISAALVAILATASVLIAAPQAAQAANRDNCRGVVSSIYRSGSNIVASYVILCDVQQDMISVSAEIWRRNPGGGSSKTIRTAKTCYNAIRCSTYPAVPDLTGEQVYTGSVWAAIAERGSDYIVGCGYVASAHPSSTLDGRMDCGVKTAYF
jgi:hypothetical protein